MEIIYKDKRKVNFEMVAIGDVFSYNGDVYMRIQQVKSYDGIRYNAATLKEGLLMTFKDTNNVAVIDADLVIK